MMSSRAMQMHATRSLRGKFKTPKMAHRPYKKDKPVYLPKRSIGNPSYGKVSTQFGLGEQTYGVHCYSQLYSFQCGALGLFGVEQVWSLNDLFDPDFTGVGHQPYLRDQYAALYAKYKVQAVKVETVISDPSADGIVIALGFSPPADATTFNGQPPSVIGERPNAELKYVNNTGPQVTRYNRFRKISTISGLSMLQFHADQSTYSANVGASPAAIPKLRMAIAALDGASTPTVKILIKLTFYAKWYDRIIQGQS